MMKKTSKHWNDAFGYAEDCVSGKIPVNHYRVLCAKRFLDDYESGNWDFKPADANFVIDIIEKTICHAQGETFDGNSLRGKPFKLTRYHKFIVYNLLGFYIKGTKVKRFHEALIFLPRKNIKTTFAGALAYALSLLYRKSGAQTYVVAAAMKQTLETFDFLTYNIKRMGEWDADGGHFHIVDNNNGHTISAEIGGGSIQIDALASNPDAQDSFNCNIAICDEIHAFKKAKQYNLFKEAMKAYSNKLLIGISTAGDDPTGFLAGRVVYSKKVLDGTVKDDQYFAFICEADETQMSDGTKGIDYTNPATHAMANPGYGISIRPEDILQSSIQAQNDPQQRKDFFAKELNVFTAPLRTYFDVEKVQSSDKKYSWTLEQLRDLKIKWYGGADLSKRGDLSAAALCGKYKDVEIVIAHGFMPATTAATRAETDNIPFQWWAEKGWLTLCNSDIIEYSDPVRWFVAMKKYGFNIAWVGYDRRLSSEFVTQMYKAGFKCKDQKQLYVEKTEAFREIENKINVGQFYFMHNKAFEYCISNVRAVEDGDDFVRFSKVNPTQRIDLFDASVIACKQMLKDQARNEKYRNWMEDEEEE